MGGQNCHTDIVFDGSVTWLARFRLLNTSSPPAEVRDYRLASKASTLQYLQQRARIPSPKLYDYGCGSDNPVGVGYMLMEKMKGSPLNWAEAKSPQKAKVIDQLVDIYFEIERHPFDSLGSIVQSQSGLSLDGFAENRTFKVGSGPREPFRSQTEADQATVNTYLRMIASGDIASVAPVDAYLVHRFRLDVVQKLVCESVEKEHFFLKHPDDKGDHIFVDDDYNIIGIVDWEWTRTESKAYAFSSPCMMWPVAKFYEASNELSDSEILFAEMFKERGREDLAEYVLGGRKVQRFYFNFGGDSQDRTAFLNLFDGLRLLFETSNGEEEEDPGRRWGYWKDRALVKYKDDALLHELIERESCECGQAVGEQ